MPGVIPLDTSTAWTLLDGLFDAFTGFMTNIVTTMTTSGNEIMLIPVGVMVVGGAIGLARRLIMG